MTRVIKYKSYRSKIYGTSKTFKFFIAQIKSRFELLKTRNKRSEINKKEPKSISSYYRKRKNTKIFFYVLLICLFIAILISVIWFLVRSING